MSQSSGTYGISAISEPEEDAAFSSTRVDHSQKHLLAPKANPDRRPSASPGRLKLWYWELGSAIVSCVCLGLMFGVLAYINGKSYSDWGYRVAPNAVISILVTVGKSSMLVSVAACLGQLKWTHYDRGVGRRLYQFQIFDEASRGPYGALRLLWSMAPSLATVGCLITVLSLAIDPFAQQILRFPLRRVASHNGTTAYAYRAQMVPFTPPDDDFRLELNLVPRKYKAAMILGFADRSAPTEPVCPTGDCEYPDFTTLGLCSKCLDVTDESGQECTPYERGTAPGNVTVAEIAPAYCIYRTPGGIDLRPGVEYDNWEDTGTYFRYQKVRWTSDAFEDDIIMYSRHPFAGIPRPMVKFGSANYMAAVDVVYTSDNLTRPEVKPNLMECALYFCEKLYQNHRISPGIRNLNVSRTQPLVPQTFSADRQFMIYTPAPGNRTLLENSNYTVHLMDLLSLTRTLEEFLHDDGSNGPDASLIQLSRDINVTMEHLAASLTDTFRTSDPSTRVGGTAYFTESYILVRWEWATMPLVLISTSVLFLVITVFAPRTQHGGRHWKLSTLALLIHDVRSNNGGDEQHRDRDLRLLRDVTKMDELAKQMMVSIEEDAETGQLAFVEHQE